MGEVFCFFNVYSQKGYQYFEVKVDVQKGNPKVWRKINNKCVGFIQSTFHALLLYIIVRDSYPIHSCEGLHVGSRF